MKKRKNETCLKKDETLVVYHKYPKQWYYDKQNGQIFLCRRCANEIDQKNPLVEVLSIINCEERIKNFLLEKKCPLSSQL